MILVSHLTKRYGPRTAVDDLSFEVKKGEIVGFLGPNGAGKSSTMKILSGFMPATDGTAVVADFDVFTQSLEVKRNVGFLPETPPLYLEMQVEDYLDHVARLKQVPKGTIKKAIDGSLEKTSLGDSRKRLIGNLSKGMRQRVGLAQALINNPRVLILDEPTVGLDPRQIIDIRSLIKSLRGEHTVILSTHILPEVTATCDRVIVINRGRIVAQDTIDTLTQKHGEGTVFKLALRNPTDPGLEALRRVEGVESISANGTGSTFIVKFLKGTEGNRDQLLAAAVQQNLGPLEFSAERASLEDIFLKLITQESLS
jgi:ABC-2 type transport system ATP-binding protein